LQQRMSLNQHIQCSQRAAASKQSAQRQTHNCSALGVFFGAQFSLSSSNRLCGERS
jgi:hypothetical protein